MARTHRPDDSLDLLLDTMCNAFGGIIMIAILVALLAKDPKAPSRPPVSPSGQTPTQQQIAELEKQKGILTRQIQDADAVWDGIKERDKVKDAKEGVEKEITAAMASDQPGPGGKPNPVAALQGTLALLEKKEQQLRREFEALGKIELENRDKRTIKFNPPSPAKPTEKAPFNLIFRHDRMYQPEVKVGEKWEFNKETMRWIGPYGIEGEPIPEKGIDLTRDKDAVLALIRSLPAINKSLSERKLYVASYVFPDSFRAYLQFKQLFFAEKAILEKTGVPMVGEGWEPRPNLKNLKFGDGTQPDL